MYARVSGWIALGAAACLLAGCASSHASKNKEASQANTVNRTSAEAATPATSSTPAVSAAEHPARLVYVARLHPLNSGVTHLKTSGWARFVVEGDKLTIDIRVKNAPPGMQHWQHIHGFKDGRAASVPTMADDKNGDGIIDLIETSDSSGTTMIPLNADPVAMNVAANTYPETPADGSYRYHKVVSLSKLEAAFQKAFPGQKLDLAHRVVFIHGVPSNTKLPGTVASLGTIPAQVTLPIAAGKIEEVRR